MARRQPTAEQKKKAQERRERFAALAEDISKMSEEQRSELMCRFGAVVTVEGRPLSNFNTCLLLTQMASVSMVGGFQQWKKHGRCVKKGEHGLMIWVPKKIGESAEAEKTAEGEAKRIGYLMGTVFDVSQTKLMDDPSEAQEEEACTSAAE